MGKIKVTTCDIEGLYVIEPTVFKDERGYFMETYNQNDFKEAGLNIVVSISLIYNLSSYCAETSLLR